MYATRLRRTITVVATMLVAAACDSLSPFEPEITSATDNFQLQATGVTNVTSTIVYPWTNTGSRATINHSTTTTAGTAAIVVRDANNAVVYTKTLAPSLSETTTVGVAGGWKIELTMTNYSGTLNFRVQKL